jgi:hypothetical protein
VSKHKGKIAAAAAVGAGLYAVHKGEAMQDYYNSSAKEDGTYWDSLSALGSAAATGVSDGVGHGTDFVSNQWGNLKGAYNENMHRNVTGSFDNSLMSESDRQAMHDAARRGDSKEVKQLVDKYAGPFAGGAKKHKASPARKPKKAKSKAKSKSKSKKHKSASPKRAPKSGPKSGRKSGPKSGRKSGPKSKRAVASANYKAFCKDVGCRKNQSPMQRVIALRNRWKNASCKTQSAKLGAAVAAYRRIPVGERPLRRA